MQNNINNTSFLKSQHWASFSCRGKPIRSWEIPFRTFGLLNKHQLFEHLLMQWGRIEAVREAIKGLVHDFVSDRELVDLLLLWYPSLSSGRGPAVSFLRLFSAQPDSSSLKDKNFLHLKPSVLFSKISLIKPPGLWHVLVSVCTAEKSIIFFFINKSLWKSWWQQFSSFY